jgi:hypothetical protein
MNLDAWKDMLPLDSTMNISGLVKMGVDFDGHYADIEKQAFNDLKVEGSLGLEQFFVNASDLLPTKIEKFNMKATPASFAIEPSSITYGSYTVNINEGRLDNMLAYALHGETLSGALRIQSNHINLNEWMPASEESTNAAEEDTSALAAPQIPENINLVFTGNIGRLDYEDYTLQQCEAKIHIHDGKLDVNPLKASIWGSQITFSTNYAYLDGGKPEMKAAFALNNVIPKNIGQEFKMIQTYAPIVKDFDAPMNISMDFFTALGEDLSVDMKSRWIGSGITSN